jgi:N-acyl-L-homoserine lactone synthetase
MLTDVFPDLIGPDQEPFKGQDVWEISRIFSTRTARKIKRETGWAVTTDILQATMEWVNDAGIERMVGVIDLPGFPQAREIGWNLRMTGLPLDTPDGPIVGIEVANTVADIESFRKMNGRLGRAARVVNDEDIAAFGSLEAIEAEFAILRADGQAAADVAKRSVDRSA